MGAFLTGEGRRSQGERGGGDLSITESCNGIIDLT